MKKVIRKIKEAAVEIFVIYLLLQAILLAVWIAKITLKISILIIFFAVVIYVTKELIVKMEEHNGLYKPSETSNGGIEGKLTHDEEDYRMVAAELEEAQGNLRMIMKIIDSHVAWYINESELSSAKVLTNAKKVIKEMTGLEEWQ